MQLAYLAGLIDGEGSIGFARTRHHWHPRIIIANTSLELLEEVQRCFGGNISAVTRSKPSWKAAYNWRLANSRCVVLLAKLSRYLRLKEPQAQLTFIWDALRPGRGSTWDADGRKAIELLVAQAHWLNRRGIHDEPEPMAVALASFAR
jgi:hypothetical protein